MALAVLGKSETQKRYSVYVVGTCAKVFLFSIHLGRERVDRLFFLSSVYTKRNSCCRMFCGKKHFLFSMPVNADLVDHVIYLRGFGTTSLLTHYFLSFLFYFLTTKP